ncbi:MAG: hypothetical protein ACOCQN_04430, partial [Halanaerobiaceae bacterium]
FKLPLLLIFLFPAVINIFLINDIFTAFSPELELISKIRGKEKYIKGPQILLIIFVNILACFFGMGGGFYLFNINVFFSEPRFIVFSVILYEFLLIPGINLYLTRKLRHLQI